MRPQAVIGFAHYCVNVSSALPVLMPLDEQRNWDQTEDLVLIVEPLVVLEYLAIVLLTIEERDKYIY